MPRQDQMADDHTFLNITVVIVFTPSSGQHHLPDRCHRNFRIIFRFRTGKGKLRIHIFKIGQPHVHDFFKHLHRFHPFITTGIVDHRQIHSLCFCLFQCSDHSRCKMCRRYQIDIRCSLFLKFQKNLTETIPGNLPGTVSLCDFIILAENTPQTAAGKKYSTRSPCS